MRLILALACSLSLAGCGHAAPNRDAGLLLAQVSPRKAGAPVEISSSAIGPNGRVDRRYTAYGDNLSPSLRWTPVAGAGAYALVVQDPDAHGASPFVHWMVWNIPAAATSLPQGAPPGPRPAALQGAVQGQNDDGSVGYFGPRPPAGTGLHHYHFQIFALDGPLTVAPGASLSALAAAMKSHVIADGETIGAFEAPPPP